MSDDREFEPLERYAPPLAVALPLGLALFAGAYLGLSALLSYRLDDARATIAEAPGSYPLTIFSLIGLAVVLHELLHCLVYALEIGPRQVFIAWSWRRPAPLAVTRAPVSRRVFLVAALTPTAVYLAAGLTLLLWLKPFTLWAFVLLLIAAPAGVGDLMTFWRVWRLPGPLKVRDQGPAIEILRPRAPGN